MGISHHGNSVPDMYSIGIVKKYSSCMRVFHSIFSRDTTLCDWVISSGHSTPGNSHHMYGPIAISIWMMYPVSLSQRSMNSTYIFAELWSHLYERMNMYFWNIHEFRSLSRSAKVICSHNHFRESGRENKNRTFVRFLWKRVLTAWECPLQRWNFQPDMHPRSWYIFPFSCSESGFMEFLRDHRYLPQPSQQ